MCAIGSSQKIGYEPSTIKFQLKRKKKDSRSMEHQYLLDDGIVSISVTT